MKFLFDNNEGKPLGNPSKVKRWYDRHTRSWVLQVTDDNGFQIGKAVYVHSKDEALSEESRLYKEIEAGEWDNI